MKTRGQISASHCPIIRVPTEVFTEILKYSSISHLDLRAVASTCRRLRIIARPLMDQEMHIVANRKASFDPLIFMGKNAHRGELLRILFIDVPEVYAASPSVYIPSIVAALPTFVNLTSISLPSPLINDAVFVMVYAHPLIEKLEVVGYLRQSFNTLNLDSPVRLPRKRVAPLEVPKLEAGFSLLEINFLEKFLNFLQFHSVVVPALWFGFETPMDPPPSLLRSRDIQNLNIIYFQVAPIAFRSAYDYLEKVMETQTSLEVVSLGLRDWESEEGFEVGGHSWKMFIDGAAEPPSFSFQHAWAGTMVRCIDTDYYRESAGQDFVESALRIRFVAGSVVKSRMIRALARQTNTFAYMLMADESDLRWPDWFETVAVMSHELAILGVLYIDSSLTPTPTVTTTLACSQACYTKLAFSHPSLHDASEVIGGYLSLFDLLYNLHVARLQLLHEVFADGKDKVLHSTLKTKKGLVVQIEADVGNGEDGEWEMWVDKLDGVPTEEKVNRCRCFGCGDVKDGEDPISAIMECEVDEVREALAVGGFDLDAFDSRSPSSPIEQDSFESFLRSNS